MTLAKIFHSFGYRLILVTIISCQLACESEDPASKADQVTQQLSARTWKIQSVKVDDVDKSDLFKDMLITFDKGTYTVVNGGLVWPSNGSWSFTDQQASSFVRADGVVVSIEALNQSMLQLSLTWSKMTFGPGRGASVAGKHVFTFVN